MNAVIAVARLLIKEIFRKKDFYVALVLMAVVLFYASGMNFYNVKHIVRYLMELGLTLVFFFSVVLAVPLAARQFPAEKEQRTLQVLLAKPITRWQFVVGKFLGAFLASGTVFAIFYGLFMFIVSIRGGVPPLRITVETFYVFLLNLMVLSAMAGAFSYFLTVSANVSISLILYFLLNIYGPALKQASAYWWSPAHKAALAVYYAMPHFEFFDLRQRFVHDWGPLPGRMVGFLTAYAVVYTLIFLLIGWVKLGRETV